jgi:hypothetical protein
VADVSLTPPSAEFEKIMGKITDERVQRGQRRSRTVISVRNYFHCRMRIYRDPRSPNAYILLYDYDKYIDFEKNRADNTRTNMAWNAPAMVYSIPLDLIMDEEARQAKIAARKQEPDEHSAFYSTFFWRLLLFSLHPLPQWLWAIFGENVPRFLPHTWGKQLEPLANAVRSTLEIDTLWKLADDPLICLPTVLIRNIAEYLSCPAIEIDHTSPYYNTKEVLPNELFDSPSNLRNYSYTATVSTHHLSSRTR